ncbi:hypothetical protein GCM10010327_57250 [Streptomyces nitrosporeus]|nr:hypothetical protein GCM10010327_57250 [Streptomyces nitrosporeus]
MGAAARTCRARTFAPGAFSLTAAISFGAIQRTFVPYTGASGAMSGRPVSASYSAARTGLTSSGATAVRMVVAPGGRLIFHVFAALAEFIRERIVQGTDEGLAAARARGRFGGQPSVVNDKLLRAARDMLPNSETIAALLGVLVGTLYNHIPGLKELRTSRVPVQLVESTLGIPGRGPGEQPATPGF